MSAVPSSNPEAKSLADEVRGVRERVATRLAELAPLVQEYEELRRLADELGIAAGGPSGGESRELADGASGATRLGPADAASPGAASAVDQAGAPAPGPRTQPGPRRAQASDGERRQRILGAVRAKPGSTVAEVAAILGTQAKALYRPVRDLTSSGALVKRGRQLFPE